MGYSGPGNPELRYTIDGVRLQEPWQPLRRVGPMTPNSGVHTLDLNGASRDDTELGVEALEIELSDDAVMSLFDQEHPRTWFQALFDEPEFTLGQTKADGVIF